MRPFQLAILTHLLYSMKPDSRKVLMEAGCGVGNLFFPLLEEIPNLFIQASDNPVFLLSHRSSPNSGLILAVCFLICILMILRAGIFTI